MSKYDGRMKAIEKKIPRETLDGAIVQISNDDGTITTDDGRRLQAQEYKNEQEKKGLAVILVGFD